MKTENKQYQNLTEIAIDLDLPNSQKSYAIKAYERAGKLYDAFNKPTDDTGEFLRQFEAREHFQMAVANRRIVKMNGKSL